MEKTMTDICPFCGAEVDKTYGTIYFCGTEIESQLRGETCLRNELAALKTLLGEVDEMVEAVSKARTILNTETGGDSLYLYPGWGIKARELRPQIEAALKEKT
jgi:hypothetical protein